MAAPETIGESQALTRGEVISMADSFLQHIADHWEIYQGNLPHLRRTMVVYNEFAMGIRYLPEDENHEVGFSVTDHLLGRHIATFFGDSYNEHVSDLINSAHTFRKEFREWEGYAEPPDDSPEAPFKGFTEVEESPEQKEFLDRIRKHPRIKLGIQTREKALQEEGERYIQRRKQREEITKRLEEIRSRRGILWEEFISGNSEAQELEQEERDLSSQLSELED